MLTDKEAIEAARNNQYVRKLSKRAFAKDSTSSPGRSFIIWDYLRDPTIPERVARVNKNTGIVQPLDPQ